MIIKLGIVGTLTIALLLGACTNETADTNGESETTDDNSVSSEVIETNTIVESQLTERERAILFSTSSESLVFDFNVNSTYTNAAVWIERYEFGEVAEWNISSLDREVTDSGYIVFVPYDRFSLEQEDELFLTVSIISGLDSSSTSTSELLEEQGTGPNSGTIWETVTNPIIDLTSGEVVLGSLITSSTEEGISRLSRDFYANPDENLEEIEGYEQVYLIKAEFSDEEIN